MNELFFTIRNYPDDNNCVSVINLLTIILNVFNFSKFSKLYYIINFI